MQDKAKWGVHSINPAQNNRQIGYKCFHNLASNMDTYPH